MLLGFRLAHVDLLDEASKVEHTFGLENNLPIIFIDGSLCQKIDELRELSIERKEDLVEVLVIVEPFKQLHVSRVLHLRSIKFKDFIKVLS